MRAKQAKKRREKSYMTRLLRDTLEIINVNFSLSTNTRGRTTNFLKQRLWVSIFHLCEIFARLFVGKSSTSHFVSRRNEIKIQRTSLEGISVPTVLAHFADIMFPVRIVAIVKTPVREVQQIDRGARAPCVFRSPYRLKSYLKYVYIEVTTGMTPVRPKV